MSRRTRMQNSALKLDGLIFSGFDVPVLPLMVPSADEGTMALKSCSALIDVHSTKERARKGI